MNELKHSYSHYCSYVKSQSSHFVNFFLLWVLLILLFCYYPSIFVGCWFIIQVALIILYFSFIFYFYFTRGEIYTFMYFHDGSCVYYASHCRMSLNIFYEAILVMMKSGNFFDVFSLHFWWIHLLDIVFLLWHLFSFRTRNMQFYSTLFCKDSSLKPSLSIMLAPLNVTSCFFFQL